MSAKARRGFINASIIAGVLLPMPVSGQAPPAAASLAAAIRAGVTLAAPATLENAQVSLWRATSGPQIGDGLVCLKLDGPQAGYIAVFFEGGKVLSYRRAVQLDACERLTYAALARPAPTQTRRVRAPKPSPAQAAAH